MDTNKIFIFGNGEISQMVSYYFKKENKFDILGYVVDDDKFRENSFLKKKIITTSELITEYSSKDIKLHIAISYTNLNKNRQRIYLNLKKHNFKFVSYISDKIYQGANVIFGENCFIQENQTIQDNVNIGNNVMIWAGNHIGHNSKIGNHTYISSHNVISGHVSIGERCFIGVNSSFKDFISIGNDCLIGMCSKIMNDIKDNSVVLEEPSKILDGNSRQAKFIKNKI